MRNNKIIKFAAIALLSAFALTACDDDIIAKPTGYGDNSPVVTIKDNNGNPVKVYNNNFDANVKRLGEEKKLKEENGLTGAPMQEQDTGSGKDNEEDNDDGEK